MCSDSFELFEVKETLHSTNLCFDVTQEFKTATKRNRFINVMLRFFATLRLSMSSFLRLVIHSFFNMFFTGLSWVKDQPSLPTEELDNFFIEMEDFKV